MAFSDSGMSVERDNLPASHYVDLLSLWASSSPHKDSKQRTLFTLDLSGKGVREKGSQLATWSHAQLLRQVQDVQSSTAKHIDL